MPVSLGARLATLSAAAAAAAAGCCQDRRAATCGDATSLAQLSAQRSAGGNGAGQRLEAAAGASNEEWLGTAGMLQLLGGAQGGSAVAMPKWEANFHERLVRALPVLTSECGARIYSTPQDCSRAENLTQQLIGVTSGKEPSWTFHQQAVLMVGLGFWLYAPGTLLCFSTLDGDHNGGVTEEEMSSFLGASMMKKVHPVWRFLDQDSDGQMTREELHRYLRAAILLREHVPQLDIIDPKAETQKCLFMAQRVLAPPAPPPRRLGMYQKLLCIFGLTAVVVLFHCCFCHARPKVTSPPRPPVRTTGERVT